MQKGFIYLSKAVTELSEALGELNECKNKSLFYQANCISLLGLMRMLSIRGYHL